MADSSFASASPPAVDSNPVVVWLLAGLTAGVFFVLAATFRPYQTDFWYHLARGRAIVSTGQVTDSEQYTYTLANTPHLDPNWLGQVLFYAVYQLGGVSLVRLLNTAVLTAMMIELVFLCRRRSRWMPIAAALGLLTSFGILNLLLIRPQSFSYLLFVELYILLDASERRRWLLWLALPLVMLWANLHGGFPVAFLLLGAFLLGALWEAWQADCWRLWRHGRARDLALCLTGCALVTLVNPSGWQIYGYVGMNATVSAGRGIVEWLPPGLQQPLGKLWVVSLLLVLAAFLVPARRPTAREIALVFCFLPPACGAVRMLAWWYLAVMPVVAAQLGAVVPPRWKEKTAAQPGTLLFALGSVLLLTFLAIVVTTSAPTIDEALGIPRQPQSNEELHLQKAAAYIGVDQGGQRNIFCRFEWGEYLVWALSPHGCKVFLGGQIPICPDPVWKEYLALSQGRGDWQTILKKYDVTCLVLEKGHPLEDLAEKSGEWTKSLQVGSVCVFFKREAIPAPAPISP